MLKFLNYKQNWHTYNDITVNTIYKFTTIYT
jgi:hypothetical protein